MAEHWQKTFLDEHRLPSAYLATAARYFDPLVERLRRAHAAAPGSLCVALNGSQGSGKSTLCAYLRVALAERHGLQCLDISLDDFYLTRAERESLAARVHPLLRTRGVPGTHDVKLLRDTLDALQRRHGTDVAVPRFDKANDDRAPRASWTQVTAPVAVVLLEGWCLGARAVSDSALAEPLNDLERDEDPHGTWRRYINRCLRETYEPLYDEFDLWLMLAAPGFEQVLAWRTEQEDKLRAATGGQGTALMSDVELRRFVAHFERLTRQCLAGLPDRVDVLLRLDARRRIIAARGLED
jgi:D-glycerate 3-kinase